MTLTVIGLVVFCIFTRVQILRLRRQLNNVASCLAHARDSTGKLLLAKEQRDLVW